MAFKFQGVDFLHLDSNFTEDELLVRRTARDFVEDNLIPIIEECFRTERFPRELVPVMGELGFFGANLEGYGCAGMSNVEYGLVMQELERGDSGFRSFVSVQSALVMYPIYTFGSDEQKDTWLPALASGKKLGCFGLTEPGFGSNPGGMTTTARKVGDEYILNGEKMWITSGNIADVAIIWAKVEEEDGLVRGFLVETERPGFTAYEVHGKWSLRASITSGLSLQDVHVPASNLLPGTGGLKSPLMCLTQARYGIAWGTIGSAMAVYDEALRYAKTRIVFDKPIAGFQIQQQKLVWMADEISKAQLVNLRLGRLKEQGRATPVMVSSAKRTGCWVARECAKLGREILGANGIMDEYQVGRHMCNIESVYTYEGTHDIHTLILGEHLTGIAAYK